MFYYNDHKGKTKNQLFEEGIELIDKFVELNNLKKCNISINNNISEFGFFIYPNLIKINLKNCKVPASNLYSWTYPGYKADLTPIGVLSHEVGHYVYNKFNCKNFRNKFSEEFVSSYEPNSSESFAETMKLFLTNPDLLKNICPNRFEFLIDLGLKYVINDDWKTVLQYADQRWIKAATNLIKSRKKFKKIETFSNLFSL